MLAQGKDDKSKRAKQIRRNAVRVRLPLDLRTRIRGTRVLLCTALVDMLCGQTLFFLVRDLQTRKESIFMQKNKSFVVIDIETTGLNSNPDVGEVNHIIEVAR